MKQVEKILFDSNNAYMHMAHVMRGKTCLKKPNNKGTYQPAQKCTKYEPCTILHMFDILYCLGSLTSIFAVHRFKSTFYIQTLHIFASLSS